MPQRHARPGREETAGKEGSAHPHSAPGRATRQEKGPRRQHRRQRRPQRSPTAAGPGPTAPPLLGWPGPSRAEPPSPPAPPRHRAQPLPPPEQGGGREKQLRGGVRRARHLLGPQRHHKSPTGHSRTLTARRQQRQRLAATRVTPTTGVLYKEDNYIIMTTVDKEKYKCILPLISSGNEEEEKDYKGPTPRELLEPLFKQSSCSYRIESYWTYEVCHGKHIRQYHEEKETGQKINIQEYYLGNTMIKNSLSEAEAKHEILSVAEVTTCEYEVVILTPLLCNHPKYRFRASPVNDIFCQSLPGSPLKPHNLEQLEKQQEMMKMPFRRVKEEEMHSTKEEKFSSIHKPVAVGSHQLLTVGTTHISKLTDDQLIKEFLSGSYCFHGGVGWWKYEFCYGKYVHQYHEDKESGKTSVVVGTWSKEEHIEWSRKNAARTYYLREDGTQTVRMVSHFYGNGDVCDLTDKPRQVTVKLKCKESDSPHAVTIYMLEPHSCQYILGVESPVICKILDTADEYGLLSVPS
uniref:Endoplasmic reticulum lectin n=1 Tax=Dromaius novaehollandiae TaxID=8790 RepID=A0A8C4JK40_DRONO